MAKIINDNKRKRQIEESDSEIESEQEEGSENDSDESDADNESESDDNDEKNVKLSNKDIKKQEEHEKISNLKNTIKDEMSQMTFEEKVKFQNKLGLKK